MKLITLYIALLITTGCTVVTARNIDTSKQALSDIHAAQKFLLLYSPDQAVHMATSVMSAHADNMAKAMEIDVNDLPGPRVSKSDWKMDPIGANTESNSNIKKDGSDIETSTMIGLIGAGSVALVVILTKLGSTVLAGTPFGNILGKLGTIFGQQHPVEQQVQSKITKALDAYKVVDPEWRSNKLFVMLSDIMTDEEKDFVKKQRDAS